MTQFKQALLNELITRAEQSPVRTAPAHRAPATTRVALAVCAVAVAVVALVVNPFGGDPAYAIERHTDGTVSITFYELADPEAATRDLRDAGVPAQVVRVGEPGSCPTGSGGPWYHSDLGPLPPTPTTLMLSFVMLPHYPDTFRYITPIDDDTVTLSPDSIPAGAEVFIVEYEIGGISVIAFGLVPAPASTCWAAG